MRDSRPARVADADSPEIAEMFNVINEGEVRLHVPLHGEAQSALVGTNRKETKMSDMSIEAVYAALDRDWLENQFRFVIVKQSENARSSVTPIELFETVMGSRLRAVEEDLRKASPYRTFIISEISSNLLRHIPMAWPKVIELLRYHRNDIFSPVDFIQVRDEISGKNAYSTPPIATFAQYLNQMDHRAKCDPKFYESEIGRMLKVEALLRVAQLVPCELNTPKFEMRLA